MRRSDPELRAFPKETAWKEIGFLKEKLSAEDPQAEEQGHFAPIRNRLLTKVVNGIVGGLVFPVRQEKYNREADRPNLVPLV